MAAQLLHRNIHAAIHNLHISARINSHNTCQDQHNDQKTIGLLSNRKESDGYIRDFRVFDQPRGRMGLPYSSLMI